jgi:hypothetical protein
MWACQYEPVCRSRESEHDPRREHSDDPFQEGEPRDA